MDRSCKSWHMTAITFMVASGKNCLVSMSFIVRTKQKTDGSETASLSLPRSGQVLLVPKASRQKKQCLQNTKKNEK